MDSSVVAVLVVLAVIAMLGVAIVLIIRLIKMRSLIRSNLMPLQGKIVFWSAVVYGVSPLDLLPDPIYLDDIGILLGAITYLGHLAKRHGIIGDRSAQRRTEKQIERQQSN
jgi:uncharacterized membrane protein YkvA (DUF1232 family)